ncbi:LysM peptidoglycan-binding domain-containing protein [Microbacterium excoecariae]|uniref:LysM peptidoglycan-binding domain-containing protein n=1 Tax=Microbacterium excoecariae TaxID=2715210 RepID=UPI00140DE722
MGRRNRILTAAPVAVTGAVALALGATPAVAADQAPERPTTDRRGLDRALGTIANRPAATPDVAHTARTSPTYVVRAGDTVTGIAIRHGLRTVDVLTWNDLSWSSTIFPGQELTLRAPSGGGAVATAATSESAQPAQSARTTSSYTVRAGDTLWAIAQEQGVSVAALTSANALGRSAVIFPGQRLDVPGAETSAPRGTVAAERGEASSSAQSHTVRAGDTLWSIARDAGLSVGALLDLNDLTSAAIIYPGQDLVLTAPPEARETTSIYDNPDHDLAATLTAPQAENAALIIGVGRELGVGDRGIAIALATAMVESGLRNVDYGDRDSLGLFQQRPSAGWGAADQLVDRGYATRAFFTGAPDGSTRGLLDLAGWQDMGFGEAAQAVQISAHPGRYDRWRVAAYGWLAQHG